MRRSELHRWVSVLAMVGMVGALLAVPLSVTFAVAAAGTKLVTASSDSGMPCHKPARQKTCPNCPQKACPDMGTCLAKCVQQLVPLVGAGQGIGPPRSSRLSPLPSQVSAGTLVPPLIRPPNV